MTRPDGPFEYTPYSPPSEFHFGNSPFSPHDSAIYVVSETYVRSNPPDYEGLQPMLGWCNLETIKRTFAATTQYGKLVVHWPMRKHYKSRNPVLNIARRSEDVASDTIVANTPAFPSGQKAAQLFVGRSSLVTDVYGIHSTSAFINTLEDHIRA